MNKNIKIKDIIKISIFKPSKYMDLLEVSTKKAILALLIVCLIPGLVNGISKSLIFGEAIDNVIDILKEDENEFEIKDGILNLKKEEIKLEEINSILYINSTKEIKDIDSLRNIFIHKNIYSAFLKDGVSVSLGELKVEYKYTENPRLLNLNNESIIEKLELAQGLKYLIIIIQTLSIFIYIIFSSFIIYILGSLISKIKRVILPTKKLYKMSIFALFVPAILQVHYVIGSYAIIIAGVYISIAINSIRNQLIKSQM